jgi:hypothetical protein
MIAAHRGRCSRRTKHAPNHRVQRLLFRFGMGYEVIRQKRSDLVQLLERAGGGYHRHIIRRTAQLLYVGKQLAVFIA